MFLRGRLVSLRASTADDVRAMGQACTDLRARARESYQPVAADFHARDIANFEAASARPFTASSTVYLSVVREHEGEEQLLGAADLWGISPHQRSARPWLSRAR